MIRLWLLHRLRVHKLKAIYRAHIPHCGIPTCRYCTEYVGVWCSTCRRRIEERKT